MHESQEWKEVLTKNGRTDAYLTEAEFSTFLTEQTTAMTLRPGLPVRATSLSTGSACF
jgi:hypothetical protein